MSFKKWPLIAAMMNVSVNVNVTRMHLHILSARRPLLPHSPKKETKALMRIHQGQVIRIVTKRILQFLM